MMGAVSGPVELEDTDRGQTTDPEIDGSGLEVSPSWKTVVGGMPVERALPRRGRRMVGAWCFLDRFGPVEARRGRP